MALKTTAPNIEELADWCLTYLAQNPEQLAEFMIQSGLDPSGLRSAIGTTGFNHGLIDYVVSNEPLLVAVAEEHRLKPDTVMQVWARLHHQEH